MATARSVALSLLASSAPGMVVAQAAEINAGYAAKMLCSTVFVSGRKPEDALREELGRAAPIPYRVDQATRSVVAWVPGAARRAVFHDGLGCTLLPDSLLRPAGPDRSVRPRPAARADAVWPDGERIDTVNLPNGIDRARLGAALDSAFAEPAPANPRRTRAVIVAYDGRIVAERYAAGFDAAVPQLGWSMTKSVTNALVGILVKQGKLAPDRRVEAPEWKAPGDPRGGIRLDDLMRMSSGLAFDETYALGKSDVVLDLFGVADAGAYAASKPLAAPIGTRWSYSSGTTNIISREIRRVIANDSAYHDFPRRALFEPLGIRTAVIEPDPSGTFVGSSYMYASARDWARLAQLYLNDGVWNGKRILPAGWVKYSTMPSPADSTGSYGAQVWINAGDRSGKRPLPHLPADAFFFRGYDRQDVAVIPSRRLVAVRLGYTPGNAWDLDGFLALVLEAVP